MTAPATTNGVDEDWRNADFLTFSGDEEDSDEVDEDQTSSINKRLPQGDPRASSDSKVPSDLPPWMTVAASKNINPLVRLHNEIVDFCKLMEPKPSELSKREEWVVRLRALAQSCFGSDCKVTVFGSQATGLLLPTSDVDVVIELQEEDHNLTEGEGKSQEQVDMENWTVTNSNSTKSPLQRLASAIRDEWFEELEYLEVIENTQVPLVKFTTLQCLSIDVCFNQDNGPKAAQLMTTYLQAMPPLRPLTFVLKYFLASRGLNEPYSGGIGSYLLQLMIVSFLQHRERDAYNNNRGSVYNLGCLLLEFLELYGMDMNYITAGISVRHDGFYFRKGALDRKETFCYPNRPFSLAMENPLDPTMDVGKASFRIGIVQRSMDVAYKVLLAHVAEPFHTFDGAVASSILATILPISPEMLARAARPATTSGKGVASMLTRGIAAKMDNDGDGLLSPPRKRRRREADL
ncbi:Cid1 family poly A polymerase [Fragilaria crotonensis]|nr:Cid1 family poly A polymerase [Fragilaria crotonensis]